MLRIRLRTHLAACGGWKSESTIQMCGMCAARYRPYRPRYRPYRPPYRPYRPLSPCLSPLSPLSPLTPPLTALRAGFAASRRASRARQKLRFCLSTGFASRSRLRRLKIFAVNPTTPPVSFPSGSHTWTPWRPYWFSLAPLLVFPAPLLVFPVFPAFSRAGRPHAYKFE